MQSFFVKHQITQVIQLPQSQPKFGVLWLPVFPKLKSPLEKERFQIINETQKSTAGQQCFRVLKESAVSQEKRYWENCVRSQVAYFEGDWSIIVLCTMFLVSCIFFNKCLYYSYYMVQYFLHQELLVSLHKDLSLRWSLPHHCLCQKETCGAEWPQATCWPVSWS